MQYSKSNLKTAAALIVCAMFIFCAFAVTAGDFSRAEDPEESSGEPGQTTTPIKELVSDGMDYLDATLKSVPAESDTVLYIKADKTFSESTDYTDKDAVVFDGKTGDGITITISGEDTLISMKKAYFLGEVTIEVADAGGAILNMGHAPYDLGYTRATMVGTTSRESVTASKSLKANLSSDCRLHTLRSSRDMRVRL